MAPPCTSALIACDVPWRSVSAGEVGGKGWNLFRLRTLGFPVPRWLVVGSSVFDAAVAGRRDTIRETLEGIERCDAAGVSAAAGRIGQAIGECAWPDAFVEELVGALDDTLGATPLLSVRSSVVGEDSAAHSFAGLMDSLLNVRRADLPAAIRRVWVSAFSERALLYRRRKRLAFAGITTAVIVQEMVQADVSGVLFTRDPGDLSASCVIAAGFGLGEGVVADAVETDTYWIAWDSDRIRRDVRVKKSRVVLDGDAQAGLLTEPVPASRRTRPALTDDQVRQLRDAGRRAERCFGTPQDIEWAFDSSGRLFILQARPIVDAQLAEASPVRRLWDNSNIAESYPGLTLPLTFTFVRNAYERTFRRAARGFLPFGGPSRPRPEVFKNLVGLLDGRVYYNLLNWYEMFSYLPAPDRYRDAWNRMIGITRRMLVLRTPVARLTRAVSLLAAIAILMRAGSVARKFFARFEEFYARHRHAGAAEATAEEVVASFRSVEEAAAGFWHLTVFNDFCAIRYHEWLTALCKRWRLDADAGLQNALLAGEKGVESVAPVRSLVRIAETVRREPVCRDLFEGGDDRATWDAIGREERYRPLKDAFEAHLDAFGDRGLEDLKLETPTFREEPERLVALVKHYCKLGLSVAAAEARERSSRLSAEAALRRHRLNPVGRRIFCFVLNRARFAIRTRENMRLARSRLFGIVRRLFRRLGEILAERGLLESSPDVYFLTTDEVLGFVEGTAVTQDLKALVRIRRAEFARFSRRELAERLETLGIPYLGGFSDATPVYPDGHVLQGSGCSPGRAIGTALVVTDPRGVAGDPDHVLVAKSTDPGWVFLMLGSAGMVVEKGSLLSHTAIIGRELGIPTVVGAKGATQLIPDGAAITLDGATGEVRWS